jgi:hypothetical protein
MVQFMTAFAQVDLHVDMYSTRVEADGFYNQFVNSLQTNLVVKYPLPTLKKEQIAITQKCINADLKKEVNVDEEMLYRSTVLMGNYLEAELVKQKPTVSYTVDGDNDFYTLAMVTPDYPFRLVPDQGSFVNWMV